MSNQSWGAAALSLQALEHALAEGDPARAWQARKALMNQWHHSLVGSDNALDSAEIERCLDALRRFVLLSKHHAHFTHAAQATSDIAKIKSHLGRSTESFDAHREAVELWKQARLQLEDWLTGVSRRRMRHYRATPIRIRGDLNEATALDIGAAYRLHADGHSTLDSLGWITETYQLLNCIGPLFGPSLGAVASALKTAETIGAAECTNSRPRHLREHSKKFLQLNEIEQLAQQETDLVFTTMRDAFEYVGTRFKRLAGAILSAMPEPDAAKPPVRMSSLERRSKGSLPAELGEVPFGLSLSEGTLRAGG